MTSTMYMWNPELLSLLVEPVVPNGLVWNRPRQSPLGTSGSTFQESPARITFLTR